ncbi:MAG: hypothetical protein ABIH46_02300, partial [Chloroflexota bacterium]
MLLPVKLPSTGNILIAIRGGLFCIVHSHQYLSIGSLHLSLEEGATQMKTKLGYRNCLYPMPTTLVGANVKGKP